MSSSSSPLDTDESWSDSGSSLTTPASSPFFGPVDLNPSVRNICVVGAGYVGGPTAAVLALHNPHINVTVIDRDATRIASWKSAHLPVHEPELSEVVRVSRDGDGTGQRKTNLFFTTDIARSLAQADMIFLAVNTPTKTYGLGAGRATDMTAVDDAVRQIARHARRAIIVEKSTVPCGTAQRIRDLTHNTFEVLSNPEFLAEGSAIANLNSPDRVLIGSADTAAGQRAARMLTAVYSAWVPASRILRINAWSSELAKLAANAMLAQRISSINAISAICERTGGGGGGGGDGAQVDQVASAVGLDPRIGSRFLKAGLGFGGSCFRKDVASLTYLAESLGLDDVADYWRQVNVMNDMQRDRFAKRVIKRFYGNLVARKITLLGFAFKKNTGDPRESLAVDVIRLLMDERPGEIAIFDPFCREGDILREVTSVCGQQTAVKVYADPYLACSQAHAVLVITDCDQFRNASLADVLGKPGKIGQTLDAGQTLDQTMLDAGQALDAGHMLDGRETYTTNSRTYSLAPQRCPLDCAGCTNYRAPMAATEPLEWARVAYNMREPKWVFDGRGILEVRGLQRLGLRVDAVGRS